MMSRHHDKSITSCMNKEIGTGCGSVVQTFYIRTVHKAITFTHCKHHAAMPLCHLNASYPSFKPDDRARRLHPGPSCDAEHGCW